MTGTHYVPMKFHNLKDTKKMRIVLSSSTLHGFWIDGYEGDIQQVDWVTCSPGASIQALLHMWHADYKPMDLLIIGGLNNLIKGESGDRFMARLDDVYHMVVSQGRNNNGTNRNTIGCATMFYPRCYAGSPRMVRFHTRTIVITWRK